MTIVDLKTELSNWKLGKHRIIDLSIGVSTLLLHEFVAKPHYRKFIYSRNIHDFHIADTLGNSLGTITAIFIVAGLIGSEKNSNQFLIKTTTMAMILYELCQPLLGKPIDPWDILATLITGGWCGLVYDTIHRRKTQVTKS